MFGIVRTIVNLVIGIIEFLLGLRFVFRFLAVNPKTPFVAWIYDTSASLVAPFAKILPDLKLGGFLIDLTTLAALIVYALIGYLILDLFGRVSSRY